jgi:hypothetical protein
MNLGAGKIQLMANTREGWTMEWFNDPRDADAQDLARERALTPQQRLDEMLSLMIRWGHVRERAFERVLEIVEVPPSH